MPLFLTGERRVGKSTALRRALAQTSLRAGGLMTDFGPTRDLEARELYLLPYGPSADFGGAAVCARMDGRGRTAYPGVFDTVGVRLLREAAADPAVDLIVIDELGFLEAEASAFRAEVLRLLAGEKPVAGVVRAGLGVWAGAPLGDLWEVTKENRTAVPGRLRRALEASAGR